MIKEIIINLKMNKTLNEVNTYAQELNNLKLQNPNLDITLCPSELYLLNLIKYEPNINICAQNGFEIDFGPHTSQTSFKMLKSAGVNSVLINHKETREIFSLTNNDINKKLISAIKNNLNVILCIGVNKELLEHEQYDFFLTEFKSLLNNISPEDLSKIKLAYEPFSAIGSGAAANKEHLEQVLCSMKKALITMFDNESITKLKFFYGGSVNDSNIHDYNSINALDGILIGSFAWNINNLYILLNKMW